MESWMAIYKAEGGDGTKEALSTKPETLYSGSRRRETELEIILFQLDFN